MKKPPTRTKPYQGLLRSDRLHYSKTITIVNTQLYTASASPPSADSDPAGELKYMPKKLTARYKKSGNWYLGWIKEIPGVNTQGKTLKEAEENLKEALLLIHRTSPAAGLPSPTPHRGTCR